MVVGQLNRDSHYKVKAGPDFSGPAFYLPSMYYERSISSYDFNHGARMPLSTERLPALRMAVYNDPPEGRLPVFDA